MPLGCRLCDLCVWLYVHLHFHLYYIDQGFLFALGAIKREVQENSIPVYLRSRFSLANGTMDQNCILLNGHQRTLLFGGHSLCVQRLELCGNRNKSP